MLNIKHVFFAHHMDEDSEIKRHGRLHHHKPNQYELHYYLQGYGSFKNENKIYELKPGSLFYSLPLENHEIKRSNKNYPLIFYALLFESTNLSENMDNLLKNSLTKKRKYEIGDNYRFFFEEIREKNLSSDDNLVQASIHQLISFLYSLASENEVRKYGDETNIYIEKSLKIMQEHLWSSLKIKDISEKLNISQAHFIRLFKDKMKTSPKQYFLKLKMETAASLLQNSVFPIYKIAEKLQFNSEFHFSNSFKQYKGISPSQYRKEIIV